VPRRMLNRGNKAREFFGISLRPKSAFDGD